MTLPTTQSAVFLLAFLAMLCWGAWANTQKAAGRWRFEIYACDFAAGALACAVIAGFTVGTYGSEITFFDNIIIVYKRQLAYALMGGAVYALGGMLLMAAISMAGLALVGAAAASLSLAVGMGFVMWLWPAEASSLLPLAIGAACCATLAAAAAHRLRLRTFRQEYKDPKTLELKRRIIKRRGSWKPLIMGLAGGIIMGAFLPLAEKARQLHIEMGPYPIAFCVAAGMFAGTLFYSLFFINLPVEGEPLGLTSYLKGPWKNRLLGFLGGGIWGVGVLAALLAIGAPAELRIPPYSSYAVAQGGGVVALLCGALLWKELAESSAPVKAMASMSGALLAAAVWLAATKAP